MSPNIDIGNIRAQANQESRGLKSSPQVLAPAPMSALRPRTTRPAVPGQKRKGNDTDGFFFNLTRVTGNEAAKHLFISCSSLKLHMIPRAPSFHWVDPRLNCLRECPQVTGNIRFELPGHRSPQHATSGFSDKVMRATLFLIRFLFNKERLRRATACQKAQATTYLSFLCFLSFLAFLGFP